MFYLFCFRCKILESYNGIYQPLGDNCLSLKFKSVPYHLNYKFVPSFLRKVYWKKLMEIIKKDKIKYPV